MFDHMDQIRFSSQDRAMLTENTPLRGRERRREWKQEQKATRHRIAVVAAVLGSILIVAFGGAILYENKRGVTVSTGGGDLFCDALSGHDTGYIRLANKRDSHYFYWFFESSRHAAEDPLVLWLNGGPGASSSLALFTENGPCLVQSDNSMTRNQFAWTNEANVIWLDQPTGVGYSYGAPEDADTTVDNVGENIYWFLQGFLAKFPHLQDREFFIAGESYGGHYVPAAAHYIRRQNRLQQLNSSAIQIKLTGIAIGNGQTDVPIQTAHFADMADNAYNITFVNASQRAEMDAAAPECQRRLTACQTNVTLCDDALDYCGEKIEGPLNAIAKRNPCDIRQACDFVESEIECVQTDGVERLLNSPNVRAMVGVNEARVGPWTMCNMTVNTAFSESGDVARSVSSYVADLLDNGLRVLIYAGDADLACNWLGNRAWTLALAWNGMEGYNAAPEVRFSSDQNTDAGVIRSYGGLSFLRVFNAGHMVPQDQPEVSLTMINRFLRNEVQ